ncbi:7783_t:CDS:2 [Paraglomus brasilianum]|uniref:DNA-directed RNA polymerase III subunit RPC9 n=1 Tax=Paraglomus brasilianum TaxID=144538 RepID=A0A9N8ZZY5_9GLOM|nr:7783_t:CDS:2 [Paraglomus brasilianum]
MTLEQTPSAVLEAQSALLSNFEVLEVLRELGAKHAEQLAAEPGVLFAENLKTIQYEIMQYLASDQSPVGSQTAEQVKNLLEALKPYPLTKSEKLQIINLRPERPVELYVIIEDSEDRGLTDKFDEILSLVANHLPKFPKQQERDSGLTV